MVWGPWSKRAETVDVERGCASRRFQVDEGRDDELLTLDTGWKQRFEGPAPQDGFGKATQRCSGTAPKFGAQSVPKRLRKSEREKKSTLEPSHRECRSKKRSDGRDNLVRACRCLRRGGSYRGFPCKNRRS